VALTDPQPPGSTIFVGGVGSLYQGDLDFGRIVVERLNEAGTAPNVIAEDLFYGGVAVCQRLEDIRPQALILVGATVRGRQPGRLDRHEVHPPVMAVDEQRHAVAEAATGYVSLDLVTEVASAFGVLRSPTIVIDLEPARITLSEELSPEATDGVVRALAMIAEEIRLLTPQGSGV